MADKKISDFTLTDQITGEELIPVVQNGATVAAKAELFKYDDSNVVKTINSQTPINNNFNIILKTINNESIYGEGNINIEGGSSSIDDVQVNGESVVENKIANIAVPTKTSDLTNNSDFVTSEDIPEPYDDSGVIKTINQVAPVDNEFKIKTINGKSLIGEGNLVIEGGEGGSGNVDDVYVNGTSVLGDDKIARIEVPNYDTQINNLETSVSDHELRIEELEQGHGGIKELTVADYLSSAPVKIVNTSITSIDLESDNPNFEFRVTPASGYERLLFEFKNLNIGNIYTVEYDVTLLDAPTFTGTYAYETYTTSTDTMPIDTANKGLDNLPTEKDQTVHIISKFINFSNISHSYLCLYYPRLNINAVSFKVENIRLFETVSRSGDDDSIKTINSIEPDESGDLKIKTINGESLVGDENIVIKGGANVTLDDYVSEDGHKHAIELTVDDKTKKLVSFDDLSPLAFGYWNGTIYTQSAKLVDNGWGKTLTFPGASPRGIIMCFVDNKYATYTYFVGGANSDTVFTRLVSNDGITISISYDSHVEGCSTTITANIDCVIMYIGR